MDGAKTGLKDYYYILGVSPEATSREIQDAYRELYDRFGPHVNVGGQDPEAMLKAFKDISEAFEVLADANRRQQYDRDNLPLLQKSHLRQLWGKQAGADANEMRSGRNDETRMEIEITLREAIKGTQRKIRIDEQLPCKDCLHLKPMQRTSCQSCRGSGNQHRARNEELSIQAGTYDKMEIRFAALGKYDARTQKNNDLIIQIRIRPHAFFTVIGRDLACTVPVTFLEAILGGEIEVPTPTGGKLIMNMKPLTQAGRVYRLKGIGLCGADLLVTIDVVVPTQISAEEVELFRKLKTISTHRNPREEILAKLAALQQEQAPQ